MKKKYRVTNWKEYNAALKKRGSLTVWIEESFENTWCELPSTGRKRGRPFLYSDAYIKLPLIPAKWWIGGGLLPKQSGRSIREIALVQLF